MVVIQLTSAMRCSQARYGKSVALVLRDAACYNSTTAGRGSTRLQVFHGQINPNLRTDWKISRRARGRVRPAAGRDPAGARADPAGAAGPCGPGGAAGNGRSH